MVYGLSLCVRILRCVFFVAELVLPHPEDVGSVQTGLV